MTTLQVEPTTAQKLRRWWIRHQVKVVGVGYAGLVYARANLPQVQHYLTPGHFTALSMVVGGVVAMMDFVKKVP